MSDQRMTPEEFADKVQYEGGVLDALEYGLRAAELDDSNPVLKGGWLELERLWADFGPTMDAMQLVVDNIADSR